MRSVRSWSAHLTAWRDRMPPRSLLGPRASPGSSVWVNRFPVRSEDQLMSDPGPTGPGFAVPIMLEPKHGTWFGALAWRDAKAGESASASVRCVSAWSPPCPPLVACGVPYINVRVPAYAWHAASGALRAPVHWDSMQRMRSRKCKRYFHILVAKPGKPGGSLTILI